MTEFTHKARLETQLQDALNDVDGLQSGYDKLMLEHRELQRNYSALAEENERLKEKVAPLCALLTEARDELDDLHGCYSTLDVENKRLKDTLAVVRRELLAERYERQYLKNRLAVVREENTELRIQLTELKDSVRGNSTDEPE